MVRRLLYLNGIAILCVIFYHTAGWGMTAMFAWTPRYLPVSAPVFDQTGSLPYYLDRLVEQIIAVAIPTFLFVSGYFMAFSTGRRDNVAWKQGNYESLSSYVVHFLTGSTTIGYYYVPLLIQYYILSPFIIPFAKNKWVLLLIVTGVFQLILQLAIILELLYGRETIPNYVEWLAFLPKWLFLARFFWFVLGIVIGLHIRRFKQFLARFKWAFLVTTVACIPLGMLEWEVIFQFSGRDYLNMRETILDSIYTLAFIFAFLAFINVSLPLSKQVSGLGVKSFGIYLAHLPVMRYTAKGIYLLAPGILGIQALFQPIIFIFGLGISLLVMKIVNYSPMQRYYTYVFG
jgi:hypothetical protein